MLLLSYCFSLGDFCLAITEAIPSCTITISLPWTNGRLSSYQPFYFFCVTLTFHYRKHLHSASNQIRVGYFLDSSSTLNCKYWILQFDQLWISLKLYFKLLFVQSTRIGCNIKLRIYTGSKSDSKAFTYKMCQRKYGILNHLAYKAS